MKKWMITLMLGCSAVMGFSQVEEEIPEPPEAPEVPEKKEEPQFETSTEGDTTRIRIGGKEMVLVEDGDDVEIYTNSKKEKSEVTVSVFGPGRNRVFQGIEFGFGGFSYSEDFDTDVPDGMEAFEVNVSNSINWAVNPFEVDVRLIDEYVKFSTGLGYNVKNFSLENNYRLYQDGDADTIAWTPSTQNLEKNRFRVGYLTIPAMLYFNSSKDAEHAFRVGAGVMGGLRLFQTYRTKYFENGQKHKANVNRGWDANLLTLDARAIVGYGGFNLYATYSLTPLFDEDHGPTLYPFTVGVAFVNVWD
jgi:hypothetical protein